MTRITPATVNQRAQELTEAAIRYELSKRIGDDGAVEELPEALLLTLQDFYFDWLGAGKADAGWDRLYRGSRQARLMGVALADVLGREAEALGIGDLIELQAHWADTESYRDGLITIATDGLGASVPVVLSLTDNAGRALGGSLDAEAGAHAIPRADLLSFETGVGTRGQFATLLSPQGSVYTGTLKATATGSFDLGVVVPDATGELVHITFSAVSVTQGESLDLSIHPGGDSLVELRRGGEGIAATFETVIVDGPPEVLGIVQNADADVDEFGRVVAVLFDEDVDRQSAEAAINYQLSSALIPVIPPPDIADANEVNGAFVQFGERIVLLVLRDPVGPFIDRTVSIEKVLDLEGRMMGSVVDRPVIADPGHRARRPAHWPGAARRWNAGAFCRDSLCAEQEE